MKPNLEKDRYFLRLIRAGRLVVREDGMVINPKFNRRIGSQSGDYRMISVRDKATQKVITICEHRLVWIAHKGLIPEGFEVNHKDGKSTRNPLSNLELATPAQNMQHSITVLGRAPIKPKRGLQSPNAKLNVDQVRTIRKLRGRTSQKRLARRFGVSAWVIHAIHTGKTYGDVAC